MTNEHATETTKFIQKLIDEKVLDPVASGTDDFNRAWEDGKYATWIDGSWRGALFVSLNPDLKGKISVTLPPSFGSGSEDVKTTEAGGSILSITSATPTDKQAAAVAFANWINSDPESIHAFQSVGGSYFMAAKSYQEDSSQAEIEDEYFGNEKVNAVYFDSATKLNTNWSTLPFYNQYGQEYKDTVVPQLKKGGDINSAIAEWQEKLKAYGTEQGFTMS
jgi:multiple sugar transport system substrate-binding protein